MIFSFSPFIYASLFVLAVQASSPSPGTVSGQQAPGRGPGYDALQGAAEKLDLAGTEMRHYPGNSPQSTSEYLKHAYEGTALLDSAATDIENLDRTEIPWYEGYDYLKQGSKLILAAEDISSALLGKQNVLASEGLSDSTSSLSDQLSRSYAHFKHAFDEKINGTQQALMKTWDERLSNSLGRLRSSYQSRSPVNYNPYQSASYAPRPSYQSIAYSPAYVPPYRSTLETAYATLVRPYGRPTQTVWWPQTTTVYIMQTTSDWLRPQYTPKSENPLRSLSW